MLVNVSLHAKTSEPQPQLQPDECINMGPVTTLMIKNVPRTYLNEALVYELDKAGVSQYDFLYLPWDYTRDSNAGYAFLNFVDHVIAQKVTDILDGKKWRLVHSPKAIKVVPAHVQGLAKSISHFLFKCVPDSLEEHLPLVFQNGQPVDFQRAAMACCADDWSKVVNLKSTSKEKLCQKAGPEALKSFHHMGEVSTDSQCSVGSATTCATTGWRSASNSSTGLVGAGHQSPDVIVNMSSPGRLQGYPTADNLEYQVQTAEQALRLGALHQQHGRQIWADDDEDEQDVFDLFVQMKSSNEYQAGWERAQKQYQEEMVAYNVQTMCSGSSAALIAAAAGPSVNSHGHSNCGYGAQVRVARC